MDCTVLVQVRYWYLQSDQLVLEDNITRFVVREENVPIRYSTVPGTGLFLIKNNFRKKIRQIVHNFILIFLVREKIIRLSTLYTVRRNGDWFSKTILLDLLFEKKTYRYGTVPIRYGRNSIICVLSYYYNTKFYASKKYSRGMGIWYFLRSHVHSFITDVP